MFLDTLYSRTSTGKVQQWAIEVDGDRYRTISGQTDGAKVTSEWTVCKGKNVGRANETSPSQQSLAEAKAKWQKKVDSGYRQRIDEIDQKSFVEPMLAKNYNDYKEELKFPVYAQPKLDGMRCIVTAEGMFSRNGKPILSAPHIHRFLKPLLDRNPELVFDGELYTNKLKDDFNKIISLAKKAKPTPEDLAESAAHLQYWCYDLVDTTRTFGQRHRRLFAFLHDAHAIGGYPIIVVETHQVYTQSTLDALYERWMAEGMEGQMIRLDAPYEQKRSKALLKRKEFEDAEFEVVDIVEGEGNRSGMAGAAYVKLPNGNVCKTNVMGGNEFCVRLLRDRQQVIGKIATVKYFNYTPDGMLRFPHLKAIRDYE